MRFKCVYRDTMGVIRLIDFESESYETAVIGLQERCRKDVPVADGATIIGKMHVDPQFIIGDDFQSFRINYYLPNGEISPMAVPDDGIIYIDDDQTGERAALNEEDRGKL